MEVERAALCDRPHARPASETLMEKHIALSNWTNIVKTSKQTRGRVGDLPIQRAHQQAAHSGEKSSVKCAQTQFIEVSFLNKLMGQLLTRSFEAKFQTLGICVCDFYAGERTKNKIIIRGLKGDARQHVKQTTLLASFLRRRSIYHRPSFTRGSEMPRSGGKAESASSLSRGSSGVVRSCTHHLFIGSDPATFDRAAFTSCGVVPNIQNWPIPREMLIESTPPSIYLLLLPPGFMALQPCIDKRYLYLDIYTCTLKSN